jgi:hypothetical protein
MQTQKKPTDIKIDQTKFNKAFDASDRKILAEQESRSVLFRKPYEDDNMDPFEPRKYTEDLGINLKNLFFDILEILANRENPMPYVMENPKKQFVFAVLILMIGVLLMFFSNLMI